ncbi:reverse transcriptase domain-containing protein [Tanacetum coccineum]
MCSDVSIRSATLADNSMWPGDMTTYNLPTVWLDVYLRPLIEDLHVLWDKKGVETTDIVSGQNFNMRAMVLWTINDFPARSSLSGWSGQGYKACPTCNEETPSIGVKNKIAYVGHKILKEAPIYGGVQVNSMAILITEIHLQQILGFQNYLPDNIAKPIIELSSLFKQLCSATLMEDDMLKASVKVVEILSLEPEGGPIHPLVGNVSIERFKIKLKVMITLMCPEAKTMILSMMKTPSSDLAEFDGTVVVEDSSRPPPTSFVARVLLLKPHRGKGKRKPKLGGVKCLCMERHSTYNLEPHMRSERWPRIEGYIQAQFGKSYNTNKATLKMEHYEGARGRRVSTPLQKSKQRWIRGESFAATFLRGSGNAEDTDRSIRASLYPSPVDEAAERQVKSLRAVIERMGDTGGEDVARPRASRVIFQYNGVLW